MSGSARYLSPSELDVLLTVAPASSRISDRQFNVTVRARFGGSSGAWLGCVAVIAVTFASNSSLALACSVAPLKNLSLKCGSKMVARTSGAFAPTAMYRLLKELSISRFIVRIPQSSSWSSKVLRRIRMNGIIREADAGSVETHLVISLIE